MFLPESQSGREEGRRDGLGHTKLGFSQPKPSDHHSDICKECEGVETPGWTSEEVLCVIAANANTSAASHLRIPESHPPRSSGEASMTPTGNDVDI